MTSKLHVQEVDGATILTMDVPRGQHVQAGQYVELSVMRWRWLWLLQRHPFVVTWCEQVDATNEGDVERKRSPLQVRNMRIQFLVKPYDGFTHRLAKFSGEEFHALIEGPWGARRDFSKYGTVLLLADGIGVAAYIPVLKELVEGYSNRGIRTRKLILAWQMDQEGKLLTG